MITKVELLQTLMETYHELLKEALSRKEYNHYQKMIKEIEAVLEFEMEK